MCDIVLCEMLGVQFEQFWVTFTVAGEHPLPPHPGRLGRSFSDSSER
jgi:hypothetical protein